MEVKIYTKDGYELLAIAIIQQAVNDYRLALKGNNAANINKLERFFLSEWGQLLSHDTGAEIIRLTKKQAAETPQVGKKQFHKNDGRATAIIVYKKSGDFVGEYKSITEAGATLSVSLAAISNCCRGIIQTTCGYIFRYKKGK